MIYMRDKRAIIIKSPKLQKIRNNLRNLIIQAYHTQWKEIHDKWRSFLVDSEGRRLSIRDFSPDVLEEFRDLQEKESQLSDSLDRSILMCVACGKADRDVVYNKAYDAWYCTECYGLERLTALERAKAWKKGAKSCEEQAIEDHSKTFL